MNKSILTIGSASLAVFVLAFFGAFGMQHVRSYTNPSTNPPTGNTAEPLNIGAQTQVKQGPLGATAFTDIDDSQFFINPSGESRLNGEPDSVVPARTVALDVSDSIIENVLDPIDPTDVATRAYVHQVAGIGTSTPLGGSANWIKNLTTGFNRLETYQDFTDFNIFDKRTDSYYDPSNGGHYILERDGGWGFFNNFYLPLASFPGIDDQPYIAGLYQNKLIAVADGVYAYDFNADQWTALLPKDFATLTSLKGSAFINGSTLFVIDSASVIHQYNLATLNKIKSFDAGFADLVGGTEINGTVYVVEQDLPAPNQEIQFSDSNTIANYLTNYWTTGCCIDGIPHGTYPYPFRVPFLMESHVYTYDPATDALSLAFDVQTRNRLHGSMIEKTENDQIVLGFLSWHGGAGLASGQFHGFRLIDVNTQNEDLFRNIVTLNAHSGSQDINHPGYYVHEDTLFYALGNVAPQSGSGIPLNSLTTTVTNNAAYLGALKLP